MFTLKSMLYLFVSRVLIRVAAGTGGYIIVDAVVIGYGSLCFVFSHIFIFRFKKVRNSGAAATVGDLS